MESIQRERIDMGELKTLKEVIDERKVLGATMPLDISSAYSAGLDARDRRAPKPWYSDKQVNPHDGPPPEVGAHYKEKEDVVKKPKHYEVIGGYEAIDIIRELLGPEGFTAYCYGNILKYSLRAKKKKNFSQDLAKAAMYQSFIGGV